MRSVMPPMSLTKITSWVQHREGTEKESVRIQREVLIYSARSETASALWK